MIHMKHITIGLHEFYVLENRDPTYMQNVECEVCEWTDNVNVQDKLWFCHNNVPLVLSIAVE